MISQPTHGWRWFEHLIWCWDLFVGQFECLASISRTIIAKSGTRVIHSAFSPTSILSLHIKHGPLISYQN